MDLTGSDIVLAAIVAVAGVIIGAKVQRAARFIYPTDFLTIGILAAVAADCILSVTGIDRMWYVPLLLGYVVGYLVVGRTSYVMVWETSLAEKTVRLSPWVIWHENGGTFLQEQKNSALFRRLFLGVRHDVVSNVPLDDDWTTDSKYPAFPRFVRPAIVAESVRTTWQEQHVIWKIGTKHYVTEIDVAYAGAVSKIQLAQDEDCLGRMQKQNNKLIAEIHGLRAQQGPALMEMALRLEQRKTSAAPVNRMYDLIRCEPDSRTKNKMNREQPKEDDVDGGDEDQGRPQTQP